MCFAHRFAPPAYMCGTATWTYNIYSLYLSPFLSLSLWPAFVYSSVLLYLHLYHSPCISLSLTHANTYAHSLTLFLSFSPSLSLAVARVVSSSRWTPFFAPCCHTSMPLPAIRNVAAASPRYLRDVSYTAPPSRMVSLLPACVRPGQKSMLGRVCLLDAHAFLGGAPFPFKPSVLLARRRRLLATWVNTSVDDLHVNNSSLLSSSVYSLIRNLNNLERS